MFLLADEPRICVPDSFIQRSSQILQAPPPQSGDIQNLQNWIEGNQCIARHQAAYVSHTNMRQELASLASPADGALNQAATWIKSLLIRVCSRYYQARFPEPVSVLRRTR